MHNIDVKLITFLSEHIKLLIKNECIKLQRLLFWNILNQNYLKRKQSWNANIRDIKEFFDEKNSFMVLSLFFFLFLLFAFLKPVFRTLMRQKKNSRFEESYLKSRAHLFNLPEKPITNSIYDRKYNCLFFLKGKRRNNQHLSIAVRSATSFGSSSFSRRQMPEIIILFARHTLHSSLSSQASVHSN